MSAVAAQHSCPTGPTFLLVHGAWHGAWCWEKLEVELAARGWASRTVDLPSASRTDRPADPLPGVLDDADVIRQAIKAIDGPVTIVAHSYGGIPATQAAAGSAHVTHLVYLAAYQLDAGENMFSFRGDAEPELVVVEGLVHPDAHSIANLYADVPEDETTRAAARLVPHSARCATDRVSEAGWHGIPSSYIVCDQDRALPPAHQEKMAARANTTYHLPSGHSPFLSIPAELATLLGACL
ncbi:alpha/beta fold hydrolase [Streptomyces sp. NPDC101150]|uniref:alpha/beta fold hydrolase n=1 Tax=Streptomyces sp. NPDC101150 TaxID=3366114 RepID=UPI003803DF97